MCSGGFCQCSKVWDFTVKTLTSPVINQTLWNNLEMVVTLHQRPDVTANVLFNMTCTSKHIKTRYREENTTTMHMTLSNWQQVTHWGGDYSESSNFLGNWGGQTNWLDSPPPPHFYLASKSQRCPISALFYITSMSVDPALATTACLL